ncbi:hypothetical protein Tco_1386557 [Tanacetum coccineum]
MTGFPAQSVRSSNADALDSLYLLVLNTRISQRSKRCITRLEVTQTDELDQWELSLKIPLEDLRPIAGTEAEAVNATEEVCVLQNIHEDLKDWLPLLLLKI